MSTRRALVTGGSGGIGRAIAAALAERGWRVALAARDEGRLAEVIGALPGDGHELLVLDVADEDGWRAAADRLGALDGLVCAAGILSPVGPLGTYGAAEFRRTVEVNLLGTLLAIDTCLPALRQRAGAIVTFSGGGATSPLPNYDAYAASKAAIVRLTENLGVTLAPERVRVNCVAPGFVATEIHTATLDAGPELAGEDYFERTRAELRDGGVPARDAAELVRLLLEEDEPWFTGKLLSAQWDAWREPGFRRRLAEEPDLATLRRIDDALFAPVHAHRSG